MWGSSRYCIGFPSIYIYNHSNSSIVCLLIVMLMTASCLVPVYPVQFLVVCSFVKLTENNNYLFTFSIWMKINLNLSYLGWCVDYIHSEIWVIQLLLIVSQLDFNTNIKLYIKCLLPWGKTTSKTHQLQYIVYFYILSNSIYPREHVLTNCKPNSRINKVSELWLFPSNWLI